MGKILKVVAVVAAIAAAIPSGGTSLLAAGLGVSATVASAIAVGLSVGASLLTRAPAPKNSPAPSERLRASIDPRAFRKSATGITALNTDIRDEEFTDNQSLLHRFIVAAAHRVQSIDEIWFDDELAWSTTGGIASKFLGYLGVECYTEGSAANAKNISSRMGSTRRYTGCAWVYLRYKLTGNDKKAESPFAQSVPTRITIRGKGAPFYDPRKDSTVPGGSGSHRADNQATWEWNDNACRNPALTLLWNLLGWRINGELSVGRGIPKERIDLESFAIAANICDESVAKAGGGTEPRYRCDGVWSEGDSPTTVTDMLKASMNADLDDVDGKLRVTIFRDDTFVSDADFTTDDVLGAFDWEPITPLDQSFNIVRGAYTDPSNQSLYQQVDYPQQQATSPDGIDRIDTFNLPMVQSVSQAQRLAALRLGRERFSGTFRAEFQATAWRVQKNSIVRLTFAPLGFVNKTFRVVEMDLREDGVVPLLLREEDSSIYVAPALQLGVVAVNSTPYDPFKAPITEAINDAVALAQSKGKVWTGPSMPSLAESAVGDTWIGPDGTFYERVNEGGITLAGYAVTLAGFRPQLGWTLSANQVLRDTLAQADAAYASANDAIDQLIGLADDDLISRNEKITKLVPEVARLEDKWTALSTIATSLGVSTTAAASARTAWYTLLGGLSPAWNDITQDTPVTRGSFDYARDTYDSALYDLDRAVKDKAASIATWAGVSGSGKPQDNATYGALPSEVAAIAAAQADADAAYSAANDAIDALTDLASDGILSRNEKITKLIPENARLEDKWSALSSVASSLSVSTASAASARSSWNSLLAGLSPVWNDTSQDTPVSRSGYNAARDAYDTALYNLDKDIKAKAATLASWSGVSGSGKPQDNATRNLVTYSGTAPASPIDGDLWVDLSGPFAVFKLRSGGAWVTGANALSAYNTLSGRPVALSDINTTESSKLAGIQSGATRNIVTYSGTAPASPQDGDLWVDISGTYAVFRLRSGSSWVEGANALTAYNALSGKPIALADINTTESSKLSGIQAGATVGAPTGTPVGTITAGDVSGTINSGGGVANNQVPTPAIQLNAVSVTSDAYTASSKTLASGTWDDVQSITVSATGAPMLILFTGQSSQVTSGVFDILRYRIIRDSTVIYGPIENWTYQDESRGFSLSARDTPPAGTVTYKVQALLVTSGGSASVAYRSLIAIETKR